MIICEQEKCCGCMACKDACPKSAIAPKADECGFVYPEIDGGLCVDCGLCQKKCPENADVKTQKELSAFAAVNLNTAERKKSSSGGIFVLLAKQMLKEGGNVCACALNEELMPEHRIVADESSLDALLGSKYVQSSTAGIWKEIAKLLSDGKKVLFCGTPCHCAALTSYLGEENENLLKVDFICHGVPSQKLWKSYLDESFPEGVGEASFRDKTKGWTSFGMKIKSGGKTYYKAYYRDSFLRIFLGNAALRESCYRCPFKNENYYSDITLGDFWGVTRFAPALNDDKGVSAVVVRTKKGAEAIEEIKDSLNSRECTVERIAQSNCWINRSVNPHPNRKRLLRMLGDNESFCKIAEEFGTPAPLSQIVSLTAKKHVAQVLCRLHRLFGR